MANDIVLKIKNLSKDFKLPHERRDSLKERVLNYRRQTTYDKLHALDDISFEVERGEFFGIVGRNGSGKSTLLKIIGGIYQPTRGSVMVNGTLTPFIELGIGFNPELTGRENVYLNGAILGLTRKEVIAKYDEIVAFAEIEKFMDQKLKNYSSGMQVRLAFSIAIQAHNDILLIDEVLAVGDAGFQRKCLGVFKQMKKEGKTVIFVTHDMSAVEEFCDRAMLIEKSKIVAIGKSYKVAREYRRLLNSSASTSKEGSPERFGTGTAQITDAFFTDVNGSVIKQTNDDMTDYMFTMTVEFNEAVDNPIFGITVRDLAGMPLFISNTRAVRQTTGQFKAGDKTSVSWKLKNIFNTGRFTFSPAVAGSDASTMLDWREDMLVLKVEKDYYLPGPIYFEHTIDVNRV